MLESWLDGTLEAGRFNDYCPNGLQVEGTRPIRRLACGVTASLAFIRAAQAAGADALLVHHGWFWRGERACLTGVKGARVRTLIASGAHLFAYHLPLDTHPEIGNNAQWGRQLGWQVDGRGGEHDLLCWHNLSRPTRAAPLAARVRRRTAHTVMSVGALERPIHRVAWCTGAAQDMIEQAAALGAQAFASGEISERTTHLARELDMVYLAVGHHASERYGVQALAARAAEQFGIEWVFIDDPNPV